MHSKNKILKYFILYAEVEIIGFYAVVEVKLVGLYVAVKGDLGAMTDDILGLHSC